MSQSKLRTPQARIQALATLAECSAKHGSVVGGPWGSLSGYGLPAFFVPLSCRAKGYIHPVHQPCAVQTPRHRISPEVLDRGVGSNRKSWDTSREQTTLAERFCPELELSQLDCESCEGLPRMPDFRIAGSPNRKSPKMKVVAEIEFFRTSHARPAGSAWKCPNGLNSAVGGTSDCRNPTTV